MKTVFHDPRTPVMKKDREKSLWVINWAKPSALSRPSFSKNKRGTSPKVGLKGFGIVLTSIFKLF